MKHFFILGPPRSGTTWLANLLTDHDTICFHELGRQTGSVEETVQRLKTEPRSFAGDCGPLVSEYSRELAMAFPDARWVDLGGGVTHEKPGVLYVPPKKQFEERTAKAIWSHCTNLVWDADRFKILSQMRVTTLEERAFEMMNPNIKRHVAAVYGKTAADLEYFHALRELCMGNAEAFEWLQQWCNLLLTWDHIIDGDPIDVQMADDTFQDMVLKWPYNNFWKQFGALLVPTLSNVITAWHYSNARKDNHHAYRVYVDTALAIAYILGGREWRDKWSFRLKDLVDKIRIEDDTRDGEL